jgi:osmotically-inducible protein OsmY
MNEMTSISQMQKFRFGSKIYCSDGEEGVLSNISFAASTSRLSHIGVRVGHFFAKTVYLPFAAVVSASGEEIVLQVSRAELSSASQHAPSEILFDRKSVIRNTTTGAEGLLKLVAVQPRSGELAYLVVHNLRPSQDTLLRREVLTKLETGRITIAVSEAQLHALLPYRSDRELQRDVEKILFDLAPLHVDFCGMNVRVLDGVLYLDGNISSSLRGEMVADQSVGVIGLLEVKNRLIGDDQLASDLALALGHDPRMRDLSIGVYPRLGVVRLSGAVHNAQEKAAAEEIASAYPGVRSVINDLIINPNIEALHVMASATGGEAEDIVPGKYIRHTR